MARAYIPVAVDRAVRERARGLCEYCRSPEDFNTDPFSIEHIYPLARGGSNDESNLALSCLGCNLAKGVRIDALDPVSGQRLPLFHPRRDQWREHFQWSENFQEVEARTMVGRVTTLALDLNRRKLQNLRRALVSIEEHPPPED
ncbi:hypothetical protein IAD21_01660 [Abditibacteriota bacterium]|nr:hypothetical protein IAD21_01660 [Abditibacteriota bacterium]